MGDKERALDIEERVSTDALRPSILPR
jgi:hypothetical protein